jgi:hypothetical protein
MLASNEFKKACLDGGLATLNGGSIQLLTAGDVELAAPTFATPAFGAATVASPSVAASGAITADASVTAGTFTKFAMRTSAAATRVSGSVGVGSGDIQVSSNVIPPGTTSVGIPGGVTMTLQIA